MALIKLLRYKLEGGGWPSNAAINFRFAGHPIGPNLASTPINQWINGPSSSQLNFNGAGVIQVYVNGIYTGLVSGVNDTPTPRTNLHSALRKACMDTNPTKVNEIRENKYLRTSYF
ncbi:hypothetical protein [Adonisia turfae]|uniref:Uncharacterized protein n=1 Tax=Adonisia turfae CCMR0081 TaxID=2292702 RepID=A0A6M0RHG2_9CYAN|nr:hypothetical protein [Adonisia turfae]NEZ55303.1 hypothetical protein [Adonisia turfae CCMR0081]